MDVNWNSFLTDEGLTLPDEQWPDFPQSALDAFTAMPTKSASNRKPGSEEQDLTAKYGPLFNDSAFGDTIFNPNDYFLSDLEVLQPFGDVLAGGETSESSPEPTSGISMTGPFSQAETPSLSNTPASTFTNNPFDQSPQVPNVQRRQAQRAQAYPNPTTYESMFPNGLDSGFVEDLSFPNGPTGAVLSSKPVDTPYSATTTKRNKGRTDAISACWTSPLCPNHDMDGPTPNPSSCSSGCAPFLFAPEDPLATPHVHKHLQEPQEVTAAEGVVEIQPRPKKRSDSDSSSEPTGRQFPNPDDATPTEIENRPQMRMKSEASQDSPMQNQPSGDQPTTEDGQAKSRRRLPHNQVERKYRESLNTQLESLRRVVPALQQNQRAFDGADIEDLPAPSKPSKAVILSSATAYIKQMEKDNKAMQEENQSLKIKMKALQALVKCEDCNLMQYVMDLRLTQQQK